MIEINDSSTEPLPWHDDTWNSLLQSESSGRLPHALLMTGMPGLGKSRFARRLAATLLCTGRGENRAPCGRCQGCHLLAAGNHPALTLIAPEGEGKAIRIDAIREFASRESLTAQGGGYKITIIEPADAMNAPAANSLLKTLEEPVPHTLIILVTSQARRLPATIKSRCQHLNFRTPDRHTALEWLSGRVGVLDGGLLLDLASGAPLRALRLSEPGVLDERRTRLDELSAISAGEAEPTAVAASWAKGDLPRLLEWLWGWAADMLRIQEGRGNATLTNPDQKECLQNLSNGIESKELYCFLDKINETIRGLGTQLNVQMSLESILLAWIEARRSTAQSPDQQR